MRLWKPGATVFTATITCLKLLATLGIGKFLYF